MRGSATVDGLKETTGSLEIDYGQAADLMRQPKGLQLRIRDGRIANFFVVDSSGSIRVNGPLQPPAGESK